MAGFEHMRCHWLPGPCHDARAMRRSFFSLYFLPFGQFVLGLMLARFWRTLFFVYGLAWSLVCCGTEPFVLGTVARPLWSVDGQSTGVPSTCTWRVLCHGNAGPRVHEAHAWSLNKKASRARSGRQAMMALVSKTLGSMFLDSQARCKPCTPYLLPSTPLSHVCWMFHGSVAEAVSNLYSSKDDAHRRSYSLFSR